MSLLQRIALSVARRQPPASIAVCGQPIRKAGSGRYRSGSWSLLSLEAPLLVGQITRERLARLVSASGERLQGPAPGPRSAIGRVSRLAPAFSSILGGD